jgi:hypothetical protein
MGDAMMRYDEVSPDEILDQQHTGAGINRSTVLQCDSYTDVAPAGPATPLSQAGQNFSMLDPCLLLPYIAIYDPLKVPLKPLKTSKAPHNRQKSHKNVKKLPQPPRGPA